MESWEETAAPLQEKEGAGHCSKVEESKQTAVTGFPGSRVSGMKTSGSWVRAKGEGSSLVALAAPPRSRSSVHQSLPPTVPPPVRGKGSLFC